MGWLWEVGCLGCGRQDPHGLCTRCVASAPPAPNVAPPPSLDAWWAPFAYEGVIREAVARLKYRNERAPLARLVPAAAAILEPERALDAVVTWAPTTRARRRARGFDQAEVIARALARRLKRPVSRLLVRRGEVAQTGRSARDRTDRRHGPRFAPARSVPRSRRPPRARSVLVVDDVATTGATLEAAAITLRQEGYEKVIALTLARTPLKGVGARPDTRPVQITPSEVGTPGMTTIRGELVRRVTQQLAEGTYAPPVDHVVEHLMVVFSGMQRPRAF